MINQRIKELTLILVISLLPILTVYLPFITKQQDVWGIPLKSAGLQAVFANWDGPNFVINALAGYSKEITTKIAIAGKPAAYYAAHLPGYSLLIWLAGGIVGVYYGAFMVNIVSNVILHYGFFLWIKKKVAHPIFLTAIFSVFPARFLTVRSVISNEMLAMAALILILALWENKKTLLSGVVAALGIWLKLQMGIVIVAMMCDIIEETVRTKKLPYPKLVGVGVSALGVITLGAYYYFATGRYDAFLIGQKISGLSMSLPLSMFNSANMWVSSTMTEHLVIYLFAIVILAVFLASSPNRLRFWMVATYGAFLTTIPHIDLPRYALLLSPIFFLTFHRFFEDKRVRLALLIILPAIYLSTINFIAHNQAPIIDWSAFR